MFKSKNLKTGNPETGLSRRKFLAAAGSVAGLAYAPAGLAGPSQDSQTQVDGGAAGREGGGRSLLCVWNRPVDPASHPGAKLRPHPAVTWEDLGGENVCHTIALRYFEIRQGDNGVRRVVNYKETLDLFTKYYDFGRAVACRGRHQ